MVLDLNTLRFSVSAMSALVRPSAIRSATSVSRSVKRAAPAGGAARCSASALVTSDENEPRPAATSRTACARPSVSTT